MGKLVCKTDVAYSAVGAAYCHHRYNLCSILQHTLPLGASQQQMRGRHMQMLPGGTMIPTGKIWSPDAIEHRHRQPGHHMYPAARWRAPPPTTAWS